MPRGGNHSPLLHGLAAGAADLVPGVAVLRAGSRPGVLQRRVVARGGNHSPLPHGLAAGAADLVAGVAVLRAGSRPGVLQLRVMPRGGDRLRLGVRIGPALQRHCGGICPNAVGDTAWSGSNFAGNIGRQRLHVTGIPGAGKDSLGSKAGPLPPGLTPIVAQSRSDSGKHLVIVGADQTADAAEIIYCVMGAVGGSLQGLRQDHLLVEHMNVLLGPVGGVAAVTGAAGRDDHGQVIRPRQARAAPAGEVIALPGGIHQGDGSGLHAVPGGIAVGRSAIQVIGDGVRDQLPCGGKGSAGHRIALDQAAVGVVVCHRPAAVHPVQKGIAGPGGVGHVCQNIVVPAQASALRRAAVARVIVHGEDLGRKHRLHGDGSGGHKKSVVGDGHIAFDHLPVIEGVSRCGNGGEGDLGARRRSFGGRRRRAAAFGLYRNVIGHQGYVADQVQPLVILILHVGIGVIREKVIRVVFFVTIRKCHGVSDIRGGDADGRAFGHVDLDGQRLAGGQIHIVGLAGNRVVLHEGLVSDPQLAAVAGVDINAAAIAAGLVILDLTAIELADRAGAVNIYAAAVAGGRIAGDLAALHNQP